MVLGLQDTHGGMGIAYKGAAYMRCHDCNRFVGAETTNCKAGCGPVCDDCVTFDSEGVALCKPCWDSLLDYNE